MIPEKVLAYAAGLFDGEGTFTLTHHKNYTFQAMVSLSSIDNVLKDFMVKWFGGRWAGVSWRLESRKLQDAFIELIEPYLILKKRQATILLEYRKLTGNKGPITTTQAIGRLKLYREIQQLNQWSYGKELRAAATTKRIEELEAYRVSSDSLNCEEMNSQRGVEVLPRHLKEWSIK